ncbi:protein of unknown function [Bradyrhizobium vignae]|uniref:Uncharacterized protein n=1 Tax=Bradyrhizobium vignae TaxID=1549949 RepID=A0A2U3Q6A4_9BRAD|nr:protein of unknown function [Bradyrhizobium vignae]
MDIIKLSVRFQKTGNGPPLLLIHTIRTPLEYLRGVLTLQQKAVLSGIKPIRTPPFPPRV